MIEIMVATMIIALIFATVYGVVGRALTAKTHSEQRADMYLSGEEAVLRLAEDVEASLPPSAGTEIFFQGKDDDSGVRVLFTVNVRRTKSFAERRGGRAYIAYFLESTADIASSCRNGACWLCGSPVPPELSSYFAGYFGEQAQRRLFVLCRQEQLVGGESAAQDPDAPVDADVQAQPEIVGVPVVDRVFSLEIQYVDPLTGEPQKEWDTTLDPPAGQPPIGLPAAAAITLQLADETELTHYFSTIIDLPLMTIPPTPVPGGLRSTGSN